MDRKIVAGSVLLAWMSGSAALAQTVEPGCSWAAKVEADTVNVAFPDDSANYWLTRFVAVPGTRLVIRGQYAKARYTSFHVYDEATRPVDRIGDFELDPDAGAVNPFRDLVPDPASPQTYTAWVEFGPKPADPAPNTIYAGSLWLDDFVSEPEQTQNPAGFLIYRVYVGHDPASIQGSVPLPTISLELANGAEVPFLECNDSLPPSTGETLTRAIQDANMPDDVPRDVPITRASENPSFSVFRGFVGSRGGFYSNLHIAYMTATTSRAFGDVFVFRAKAPTAPDTRAGEPIFTLDEDTGEPVYPDLRYWSVCQTNFETQRYVKCAPDYKTAIDDDGYFTFVISDPDDRPANATAENDVTWLPWGGIFFGGTVIYRHMLPSQDFAEAIQNVPPGTSPGSVLGEYYPVARYCEKEAFESGGSSAAASFAACEAP